MRYYLPMALVALCLPVAASGDELFSEVAVESVFGASSKSADGAAASTGVSATGVRVTGAGQLGELLRELGFEPERVDGRTVTIQLAHGQWTIPTTLHAAIDRSQVDVTMGLATPEKGVKWDANKLLRLLADPEDGGAHFAFDSSKGQVQVRQTVSAREVTSVNLGRLLTEMAEFAVSRESAWFDKPKESDKSTPATTNAAAPTSIIGSWVASLGQGEAFAIKLTADGKFQLAHVKAGKTTTSNGKAERTGDQLRLVGDGSVTISGTLSNITAEGFDLTLTSGKKLSFKKPAAK
ncbi:hypothetical protein [Botrimarina mediterranea]|uniref:Uncharacterized protein n=1 Tax=Botrimarina mediterranea TaxID=2528022 RepID=A0A518KAC9_9BACT|nr:hypothetical protein [Botrimarina mediterranea]QDV74754.1 hypothetical protein Spa11_29620 [Botrimarina mediterranea]QDV79399.1 hypothetical protein K2D_30130 [Planctomycetes bacterium K2D]